MRTQLDRSSGDALPQRRLPALLVLLACAAPVALPLPARAVVLDDFEAGAFGPLIASTPEQFETSLQSPLPPGSTVGGVRQVKLWLSSGEQVSGELAVTQGDDGLVFRVGAFANGFVDLAYGDEFGTSGPLGLDLTAGGADRIELTLSLAPLGSFGTLSLSITGSSSAFNQTITGPGTYVFAFDDFAGSPDLLDVDGLFLRLSAFGTPQASPLHFALSDIRTAPEPSAGALALCALAIVVALARRRERGEAESPPRGRGRPR